MFNSYGKEQLLENLKDKSMMNFRTSHNEYSKFAAEYDSILKLLTNGPLTQARYNAYKAIIGMLPAKDASKDPALFSAIETAIKSAVNNLHGDSNTPALIMAEAKPAAVTGGKPTGTAIVAIQIAIDAYMTSTAPVIVAGSTGTISFDELKAEALKVSSATSYHGLKDFDAHKLKAFANFLISKGATAADKTNHYIGAMTGAPFANFLVAVNNAKNKDELKAANFGVGSSYKGKHQE